MTKRIAKLLTFTLTCALLGAPAGVNAISPLKQTKPNPEASKDESVLSVLVLAKQLAESPRNEVFRLPLRYRVAIAIKRTRQELSFGAYVNDSISFWETWDPRLHWINRELAERRNAIERRAKKILLSGDQAGAKRELDKRQCDMPLFPCMNTDIDAMFLQWELEGEDFDAAVRRLKQTDWKSAGSTIYYGNSVVRALVNAGKRDEALQLLSELRSTTGLDAIIAELYWVYGVKDEAKRLMREAAAKALDEAERDVKKELPIRIANSQWIMGDKDGAVITLNRILQFDKERQKTIRASLAGVLALVGRDADAMALLAGAPNDRATMALLTGALNDRAIMANIVVGQARRGDFEAAFKTFEKLKTLPAPQTELRSGILYPLGDSAANPGPMTAIVTISRIAARAGNLAVFKQADELRQALLNRQASQMPMTTQDAPRLTGPFALQDLTRTGHSQFSIDYALEMVSLTEKIASLCTIAETLAGVPDQSQDPFAFFEPW